MVSPRSKNDWKEVIAPHLDVSLREASDAITRTNAVQQWLHDASMEAAGGLGGVTGVQGQMQGYQRMMASLEDELPELLSAVSEMTAGCGTVDLHWRPTNPNFSRLYIDFPTDYSAKLFTRLEGSSVGDARTALQTITRALPEGSPFPKRPNTVTGIVGLDDRCVGIRVSERLSEDGQTTYRSVTLLPGDGDPLENVDLDEGAQALAQLASPRDAESESD